jgi:outer membrane protein OmpA-like peptidoglycan-associated protein
MVNKVRVYGKAQNRTALGIANAYLVMYPKATLDDLNKAFPKSHLNNWAGSDTMFANIKDAANYNPKKWDESFEHYFFAKQDEVLKLQDGTVVCMFQKWEKNGFAKIVNHAKQYAIEIAEFKPRDGFGKGNFRLECLGGYKPSEEGSLRLEYLDGHIPNATEPEKKKTKWWLWLLLALLVVGVVLFFLLGNKKSEPVIVEKIVEKEIIVRDTVYVQQLAEIEKNFNAAQFVAGKADLSEEAKLVLQDLAKLLNHNPNMRLRLVGHTSKEGSEDFNQKLSEERAKAAVDFLINERNIDASRLEYKGVGSSQPLDAEQLDINRRTEFVVIE